MDTRHRKSHCHSSLPLFQKAQLITRWSNFPHPFTETQKETTSQSVQYLLSFCLQKHTCLKTIWPSTSQSDQLFLSVKFQTLKEATESHYRLCPISINVMTWGILTGRAIKKKKKKKLIERDLSLKVISNQTDQYLVILSSKTHVSEDKLLSTNLLDQSSPCMLVVSTL